MGKLEKELALYEEFDKDLKANGFSGIWPITDHISLLQHTIEKHKIQEACKHEVIYTEDASVHRRPRSQRICTACNKILKEF